MSPNKQKVKNLLKTEETVFIDTTQPNSDPLLVPIWSINYEDKIYFETDSTTVKFNNIQNRSKVVLCFAKKGGAL